MGCSTCKQKKEKKLSNSIDNPDNSDKSQEGVINLVPESFGLNGDYSGNFLFKVIAFLVVMLAIPFLILVLVGQMFLTFFIPKLLPKVTKALKDGLTYFPRKYIKYMEKRMLKKREKEFNENGGYEEGSSLLDIEDLSDITIHENNKDK
jgi:hypothetical protein